MTVTRITSHAITNAIVDVVMNGHCDEYRFEESKESWVELLSVYLIQIVCLIADFSSQLGIRINLSYSI